MLYVKCFERNDLPNNLHFSHTLHINAAMKQNIFICSWPSLDCSVAKHIVNMSMPIYSDFVNAAVKNFTTSEGNNHL